MITRLKKIGNAIVNTVLGHALVKGTAAAVIIAAPFCVTQVKDTELVVLRQFGKRVEGAIQPGLKWYWPWANTVHRYDVTRHKIEMQDKREGNELRGIGTKSLDGLRLGALATIVYTLDKTAWQAIDDNFGADDSQVARQNIEDRVRYEVRNAIQSLVPQYHFSYLLSHREELGQNAMVMVGASVPEINSSDGGKIRVPRPPIATLRQVGVLIERIDLQFDIPEEYEKEADKQAVITKKTENVELEIALTQKRQILRQEEAKERDIESKSRASAETELLRMKENVSPLTILLEKWNGTLPEVIVGMDTGFQQTVSDLVQSRMAKNKKP